MFKAVIFDLDGTLAYTLEDLRTAMNLMLDELDMPTKSIEEITNAVNYGAREFVRRCMPKDLSINEKYVQKCFETYNRHYAEHFLDKTVLYPDIEETVYEIKSKGLKLACLSNKGDDHTNALVNNLFLPDTFDHVQGFIQGLPVKPDPTTALNIAKGFNVTPDEVLYIGDSNIDMATAINAGFFACGCSWGYRSVENLLAAGADKIINNAKEILELLQ